MAIDNNARSRRDLLRDMLASGLSMGAVSLAGCNGDEDDDSSRTRRSIASLQQSDPNNILQTFREAVNQMKQLPSSDPRNWQNQVAIHGTAQRGFTECEHGNWLFLPWHRLYLFYFEEICRDLTGNDHFALPYWNWAANHQFPDIFGQSQGTVTGPSGNNPLYVPGRAVSPGDSISSGSTSLGSSWGPAEMERRVLSDPNFLRSVGGGFRTSPKGFGKGELEQIHDFFHVWVGGDMARGQSPNDPVFWTHHCFVDCVWWEWNARRGHSNPNDSDWQDGIDVGGTDPAFETAPNLSQRNTDFVDASQNTVTGSAATSLATILMPLLSFRYEPATKGNPPGAQTPQDGMLEDSDELRNRLEEGAEVELEVAERFELERELPVAVEEPITVSPEVPVGDIRPFFNGERPGQLLLTAKDITPPERNDFVTLVFVNRPDIFQEPTVENDGFAGRFLFFEPRSHDANQNLFVNVTDVLRRLDEAGEFEAEQPLRFQLATVPQDRGLDEQEGESGYTIGALDLDFTQSIIDGEVVEKETG